MTAHSDQKLMTVLLAAGRGRRFGGEKLLYRFHGRPLYRYIAEQADLLDRALAGRKAVVTGEPRIMEDLGARGYEIVENMEPERGISHSVRLALLSARDEDACLFCVCDQPFLRAVTIERLIRGFWESGKGIGCLFCEGLPGNPVIFHKKYFEELLSLEGDAGGKTVRERHREDVYTCAADSKELADIDYREDFAAWPWTD